MPNPSPMGRTLLGAVLVNWNSREDTLAAIRSLRREDPGMPIVLLDNASTDGSVEAVQAAFPDVDIVSERTNHGLAEGCNKGLEHLRGVEWVLLFNNDALAEPGSIENLRSAAASAPPDVGMVQPCIVLHDHPGIVNSTGVTVFKCGYARDRHFGEPVSSAARPAEIFSSTAGASLYRRSMLDSVKLQSGWLDRNFFMYFEDVDLGWRCRLAGWRALYVPEAVVRHKFQASSKKRGSRFVIDQCRANRAIALLKNASWRKVIATAPVTLKDNLKSAYCSGPKHLASILRRIPGALRDRRAIGTIAQIPRYTLEKRWMTTAQTRIPDFSTTESVEEQNK